MGVSVQHHTLACLPSVLNTGVQGIGGWMDSRNGKGFGEEKNLLDIIIIIIIIIIYCN
jgi:hypothetical protein